MRKVQTNETECQERNCPQHSSLNIRAGTTQKLRNYTRVQLRVRVRDDKILEPTCNLKQTITIIDIHCSQTGLKQQKVLPKKQSIESSLTVGTSKNKKKRMHNGIMLTSCDQFDLFVALFCHSQTAKM